MLDYEGKIDRSAENINRLIAEGEKAATILLRDRATAVGPVAQKLKNPSATGVARSHEADDA